MQVTRRVPEPVQDSASGAVKVFSHGKRLSHLLMHRSGNGQRGGAAFRQAARQAGAERAHASRYR